VNIGFIAADRSRGRRKGAERLRSRSKHMKQTKLSFMCEQQSQRVPIALVRAVIVGGQSAASRY
jgi:hypothetical protein